VSYTVFDGTFGGGEDAVGIHFDSRNSSKVDIGGRPYELSEGALFLIAGSQVTQLPLPDGVVPRGKLGSLREQLLRVPAVIEFAKKAKEDEAGQSGDS
jgi:hypothetical protein